MRVRLSSSSIYRFSPIPFPRHSRIGYETNDALEGIATPWAFPDLKEHRSGGRPGAMGKGILGEDRDLQHAAKWWRTSYLRVYPGFFALAQRSVLVSKGIMRSLF